MLKPLRNNVIVRMDESLPSVAGIFVAPVTSKWREAQDQIANRGTVVAVGEGRRHRKSAALLPVSVKPGDVIRFSELQYPTIQRNGEKLVVINDLDIVGIEHVFSGNC